jgi:hypothetical protein
MADGRHAGRQAGRWVSDDSPQYGLCWCSVGDYDNGITLTPTKSEPRFEMDDDVGVNIRSTVEIKIGGLIYCE